MAVLPPPLLLLFSSPLLRFCLGAALKGRIKRSSELAATQSGRRDGERRRRWRGGGWVCAQRDGLKVELIKEREVFFSVPPPPPPLIP